MTDVKRRIYNHGDATITKMEQEEKQKPRKKCRYCKKKYRDLDKLNKHEQRHHRSNYQAGTDPLYA